MPRISNYLRFCLLILPILLLFIFYELISNKTNINIEPRDNYSYCLLDVHQALESLSIPWFITFGSALMYWRSKNFISTDMDIGIFYKDLKEKSINEKKFISIMTNKFHFKYHYHYGRIDHGQEWRFSCPITHIPIDIFVYYSLDELNKTSDYWAATYNGLCNKMIYKKCRWKFKKFHLITFKMFKKKFYIVPVEFIEERYGKNYTTPHKYGYFESLQLLPNLIQEYNINTTSSKPK
ncbi:unnamed protein product [Rotaria sordida]|uniref:Uncharacterized protein n=1 Tax=Rotaria sordida TaxID=392033 RepID=A0A814TLX4_9BILA|nr:unnamed protein product [Rotaria sordida]CAF1415364.1 unnamed protein product [Rotaria sordida]